MTLKVEMNLNAMKVRQSVSKKRKKIPSFISAALDEVGKETIRIAKTKVPVRTGALQRSLDFIVKKSGDMWVLLLGSGLTGGERIEYARVQEEIHWYMKNSVREMRSTVESIFKRHLRKNIK